MPEVRSLPASARDRLRHLGPLGWAWLAVCAAAVLLDAATTISMQLDTSGAYEEANPLAAPLLSALGPVAATLLLSVWAAALAFLTFARPHGLYSAVIVWTLRAVIVLKLLVALSNLTLALTGFDPIWQGPMAWTS